MKCPYCGSNDVWEYDKECFQCNYCGNEFEGDSSPLASSKD